MKSPKPTTFNLTTSTHYFASLSYIDRTPKSLKTSHTAAHTQYKRQILHNMPINLNYTIVDAFTSDIFRGNPAAVIVLDEQADIDDSMLQLIAREFNLSETAFVKCRGNTDVMYPSRKTFGLRWFTPNMEFTLCGHATLAAAYVLSKMPDIIIPKSVRVIRFDTISGFLTAEILPDGRIQLEIPAGEAQKVDETLETKVKEIAIKAMGITCQQILYVGRGGGISFGKYVLVQIDDDFDLSSVKVNANPFVSLAPGHAHESSCI